MADWAGGSAANLELVKEHFRSAIPHNEALGMEVVELVKGIAIARIPYRDDLVGNPATGVLHGGVVTSLLDAVGGAAVIASLDEQVPIATLDLRIEYLRPSIAHQDLYAKVECYKLTYHVAFARGFAYNDAIEDPVASMSATFMLRTQGHRDPPPGDGG